MSAIDYRLLTSYHLLLTTYYLLQTPNDQLLFSTTTVEIAPVALRDVA